MKLMIITILLSVLLSGCDWSAKPSVELIGKGSSGMVGVATLADSNNPFDMAGSVVATKVGLTALLAEKKFRNGQLSMDEAKELLITFKRISSFLKLSVANKDMDGIQTLSDTINAEYEKLEALK